MNKIYKIINLSILFILVSLSFSCDILEPSKGDYYLEVADQNQDTGTYDFEKKVLLLEFTGHKCTNCPEAHRTVVTLKGVYAEKLIPVYIHAGLLAKPQGDFTYDFTTTEGSEIYSTFGISSIPTGIVCSLDKTKLSSHTSWAGEIETALSTSNSIGITIENTYNSANRNLTTKIKYKALENIEAQLQLSVFLIEDSIISKQIDAGVTIDNYVHLHAFRDALSNTWGNTLEQTTFAKGFSDEQTFTLELNSIWNSDNCSVVAFIYNNETKEVLNVEEKNINE